MTLEERIEKLEKDVAAIKLPFFEAFGEPLTCLVCGQPRIQALGKPATGGEPCEFNVMIRTPTGTEWRGLHLACAKKNKTPEENT